MRRPAPRSRRSRDTDTLSWLSHSRPTATAFSPAPATTRQGCGATPRPNVTLTGHTDVVTAAALSPDGKRVVTGSKDKTARLWDAGPAPRSRRLRDTKTASTPSPSRPTASASSPALTTARPSCGTRRPARRSRRSMDTKTIVTAGLSPDGKRILTGAGDKTARLWDAATGAALATLEGHTAPSPPSPSRLMASAFSPAPGIRRRGCGTRRPAPRSRRSMDTKTLSPRLPSRPTASACSPAPSTRRRDCGTLRPGLRPTLEGHDSLSLPSPSRLTAGWFSPAPSTKRRGCGTLRPGPRSRRSRDTSAYQRRRLSPDGKRVLTGSADRRQGCGTRRPALRSRAEGHTDAVCASPSRPTASGFSPAPTTRRQGCGMFFLPLQPSSTRSRHPRLAV